MKRGQWNIPEYELESIIRCFLPDIQDFFATDEGKEYLEECRQEEEKQPPEADSKA